jgi:uncharacterized protein (TIGR01615 family)
MARWSLCARLLVALALQHAFGTSRTPLSCAAYGQVRRSRCSERCLTQSSSRWRAVTWFSAGEQVLIDVGFKDSFQLARPTPPYQQLLDALPVDFVGTTEMLTRVLHLMCAASAEAFAAHDMVVPPWRTCAGMLLRWTSNSFTELSSTMLRPPPPRKPQPTAVAGRRMQLPHQRLHHRACPTCSRHQQHAPRIIIVGFPGADAQGPAASVQRPACRAQSSSTTKYVSEQINGLLGPMHKVKLGCT